MNCASGIISATARCVSQCSSSSDGTRAVSGMGAEPLARVADVPVHRVDQRVSAVKAKFAPQAVEKLDAKLLTVDVLVEVDQERFHRRARLHVERGPDADI